MSNLSQPIGPYSVVKKAGGFMFCSGQIAIDPDTGNMVQKSVEAEARQVLENLKAWIENEGGSMDRIVKTTIYLTDLDDFETVNRVYGEFVSDPYPARATIKVAGLPKGARIEIEAILYHTEN